MKKPTKPKPEPPTLPDAEPLPVPAWLIELGPAARWAWVAFYRWVRDHGRPRGTCKTVTPNEWAGRLDVAPSDFERMVSVAAANAAVRLRPKSDTYVIPDLLGEIAESTVRMRRLRSRQRGQQTGQSSKGGVAAFGVAEAKPLMVELYRLGFRRVPQTQGAHLIAAALNELAVAEVPDPLDALGRRLKTWAADNRDALKIPPIDAALRDIVAEIVREKGPTP